MACWRDESGLLSIGTVSWYDGVEGANENIPTKDGKLVSSSDTLVVATNAGITADLVSQ